MAWDTNKSPIEYLNQRVVYYQKQLRKVENMKKKNAAFTEDEYNQAISNIKYRVASFKKACEVLAQNL